MTYQLPFTDMGAMTDGVAVNACVASGMIVIVDCDHEGRISGIISAHTSVEQAAKAYVPYGGSWDYAIVIPTENGPIMLYSDYTFEEIRDIANT